jgi:hypothetical protein
MKICGDDSFFTVDVPVLRIRRFTPAEASRREQRWARCHARKLQDRLQASAKPPPETEPPVPWRELATGWRQLIATFDGLFKSEDEEEQARRAYHQGGPRWRAFSNALNQRKRDRVSLVASHR